MSYGEVFLCRNKGRRRWRERKERRKKRRVNGGRRGRGRGGGRKGEEEVGKKGRRRRGRRERKQQRRAVAFWSGSQGRSVGRSWGRLLWQQKVVDEFSGGNDHPPEVAW